MSRSYWSLKVAGTKCRECRESYFNFSPDFCQNRHKIKKNQSMIRDIRDIKYPRLLNFNNFATFSTRDFYNCLFSRHLIPATFSTRDFFIFD